MTFTDTQVRQLPKRRPAATGLIAPPSTERALERRTRLQGSEPSPNYKKSSRRALDRVIVCFWHLAVEMALQWSASNPGRTFSGLSGVMVGSRRVNR
jgi:hypothetical protein